ncbi:MAG TPA: glycosyltransferase family 39 protein [Anaerolineales bacterium]|nr:glycosyltransferase family 39 protein [Anaerolineales bacterium]
MYEKIKNQPEKILPALLVVSVVMRVAVAIALGNQVTQLPGTFDQVSYHELAQRVLHGFGFTFGKNWWPVTVANSPTAHWSFLYTGYLVVMYALTNSPLVARIFQAILVGVLHPFLAYRIGQHTFGPRVGLWAAIITVFYTYFIYYAGTLMTEPFYITAILGVFYFTIRLAEAKGGKEGIKWAVGLGVLLGISLLFRQLFLLFLPFLFLWLWWARRKHPFSLSFWFSLVSVGVMVVMILPITFYNYARFNRFVLLNTNAGYAFYLANHPSYGTDFIPARDMEDYQSLIPKELKTLDEAALDQALLKLGLQFVTDDPKRYILLSLDRIPEYFKFWPSSDSGLVSNLSRVSSFGLALPWMIAGLILWFMDLRKQKIPLPKILESPGTLLLVFFLVYTGIHVVSWALVRYRLPVDAILIVFAGLAVEKLWQWYTNRKSQSQTFQSKLA